jgi:hypothetical protein
MSKKIKKTPKNGIEKELNSNQGWQSYEDVYEELRSICHDLTDFEFHLYVNFSVKFLIQDSTFHLPSPFNGKLEVLNATNRLIDLKYFKILPGPRGRSDIRTIEPNQAHNHLMLKLNVECFKNYLSS